MARLGGNSPRLWLTKIVNLREARTGSREREGFKPSVPVAGTRDLKSGAFLREVF